MPQLFAAELRLPLVAWQRMTNNAMIVVIAAVEVANKSYQRCKTHGKSLD